MEKEFLLNTITLFDGVNDNDATKIEEGITNINTLELTDDQKRYVIDFIKNENKEENYETVVKIINELNFIVNKEQYLIYLKSMISKELSIDEIKYIINDVNFDNSRDQYTVYYRITPMVIRLNDSELLKELIDKIQAL